ncbi:hypothetical protein CTAYLR_007128 [Chrysophaeum taylorii]|uniref:Uncharacterized protein n=1 Tax=Chrysophaeum taylorii TaxID=2483200 RepID=A0AAD7U8Y0_9STRA|nr:hypothetical protein CTAYLR_007128 [Chrysophaeum taylorii]
MEEGHLFFGDYCSASDEEDNVEEEIVVVAIEGAPAVRLPQQKRRGIGFQLWPAARFLCEELAEHWPGGKRAIELGCGVGLCGIFAAKRFGCSVVMTDLPEVLDASRRATSMNGGCCDVRPLPWGQNVEAAAVPCGGVDVVLAADVVYWEKLHEPLRRTLRVLLEDYGATAIVAHAKRWRRDEKFFAACRKRFDLRVLVERVVRPEGPTERRQVYRLYRLDARRRGVT